MDLLILSFLIMPRSQIAPASGWALLQDILNEINIIPQLIYVTIGYINSNYIFMSNHLFEGLQAENSLGHL